MKREVLAVLAVVCAITATGLYLAGSPGLALLGFIACAVNIYRLQAWTPEKAAKQQRDVAERRARGKAKAIAMANDKAIREKEDVLRHVIASEDIVALRGFVQCGAIRSDSELTTGRGWLQFAAASQALASCRLLLAAGHDPRRKDMAGRTAEEIARDTGNPLVIACLQSQVNAD